MQVIFVICHQHLGGRESGTKENRKGLDGRGSERGGRRWSDYFNHNKGDDDTKKLYLVLVIVFCYFGHLNKQTNNHILYSTSFRTLPLEVAYKHWLFFRLIVTEPSVVPDCFNSINSVNNVNNVNNVNHFSNPKAFLEIPLGSQKCLEAFLRSQNLFWDPKTTLGLKTFGPLIPKVLEVAQIAHH